MVPLLARPQDEWTSESAPAAVVLGWPGWGVGRDWHLDPLGRGVQGDVEHGTGPLVVRQGRAQAAKPVDDGELDPLRWRVSCQP